MANRKITELNALTGANATDTDVFAIVDVSADETKKMTLGELKEAFDTGSGFVRITGDTMTGDLTVPNVVVSGNVDGRDVSADGTKLDGIEAGATADQTAAEIKTAYESNADTNEFSDAEQSKLAGIEAGADVTDTANVTSAGALMDSELTDIAAVKALNQGVATTDKPTFNGINSTEALPTIRPSLLLDFANSKTLDPRITFSRGSTATYWDGKTTTKAEENLQPRSSQINSTYWLPAQTTINADYATAPDGTSTAVRLYEDAVTAAHYIHGNTGSTVTTANGVVYTWSIYAKKGSGTSAPDNVQLCFRGNTHSTAYANFNISTGVVASSFNLDASLITSVGNGWYRLVITATSNSSGSGGGGVFVLIDNNASANRLPAHAGDTNADVLLWGPQFEQRSSATAYTPTTSSPIVKYQPTLQTAASGEARFDHDPVTGESKGLLIEEARTNLLLNSGWSNGFTSWGTYSGGVVKVDSAIAPDGSNHALTLSKSSGNVTGYIRQSVNVSSGTTYTLSFYAKKGSWDYIEVGGDAFGNGDSGVIFNLATGTLDFGSNGTITEVGNGWYRCTRTYTPTASSVAPFFRVKQGLSSNGDAEGYNYVLIWGAQLEAGSFPTSYIPTSGSSATRSLEYAEIAGTSFDFFNNQGATLYAELDMTYSGDNSKGILGVNTDTAGVSGRLISMYLSAGLQFYFDNYSFGSVTASGNGGPTSPSKVALSFSATSYLSASDGSTVANTSGSYSLGQATRLQLGNAYNITGYPLNGHLKKIACYPQQLTSATLQAMTEE